MILGWYVTLTVMVPSLPTFFIASEIMFPIAISPLAALVATYKVNTLLECLVSETGTALNVTRLWHSVSLLTRSRQVGLCH